MKDFKPKTIKIKNGSWTVFLELCKGCGICLIKCPQKSLFFSKEQGMYANSTAQTDPDKCLLCGICELDCPEAAIKVVKEGKR
jgi:2-oxoglutarate ferredoxin oxidoreductase subunit delta